VISCLDRSDPFRKFDKIPFNRFKEHAQVPQKILENHRSFSEIVNFTNQFHTEITQTAIKGSSKQAGVFFISDTDIDTTISMYRKLTQPVEDNGEQKPTYFYLGARIEIFQDIAGKYGLTPISHDHAKSKSILEESLQLLSMVIGLSQKQIREKYGFGHLSCRKLGIRLIRAITDGQIQQKEELLCFVKNDLKLTMESQDSVKLEDQLRKIQYLLCQNNSENCRHQYTSIRKAKGLEADAVLAIAQTESELKSWLATDREQRYQDTNNTCRLGFVRFSWAKQMLCIACKHRVGNEIKHRLRNLGVQIVSDAARDSQLVLFGNSRA
jgi:DNA helicase II / ATP-dependent DNA helicase PcrA